MACHNELRDGVNKLAGKAFTPAHVRNDPKIFTGHAVRGGNAKCNAKGKGTESPPPKERKEKGDLLIRNLWIQGADSIHDMHVVNTDTISYQYKTPEKCL